MGHELSLIADRAAFFLAGIDPAVLDDSGARRVVQDLMGHSSTWATIMPPATAKEAWLFPS